MSALHWMKPLNWSTNRATADTKHLSRYPAVDIDQVFAGLEVPTGLTVADIGSGTGICARRLAERRGNIWAIAPNAAVHHPGVTSWQGTVELIGLSSQSVDWITCSPASHWLEPETSLVELHQILNPQGQFASTRNQKDSTDPSTAVYCNL